MQHISPEVIMKGLKRCCFLNVVDGNDNDMLWDGSEEDGDVRWECEKDEVTVCEAGDNDADW